MPLLLRRRLTLTDQNPATTKLGFSCNWLQSVLQVCSSIENVLFQCLFFETNSRRCIIRGEAMHAGSHQIMQAHSIVVQYILWQGNLAHSLIQQLDFLNNSCINGHFRNWTNTNQMWAQNEGIQPVELDPLPKQICIFLTGPLEQSLDPYIKLVNQCVFKGGR